MNRVLSTFALCALLGLVAATALAVEPHHDLVRVPLDSEATTEFLRAHQNRLDIVFVKPGVEAHVAAKPGDVAFLQQAGLRVDMLQQDMETANSYADKGLGFGIFHTYSENVAFVDSLRLLYPQVVSEKWSIGTTGGGSDIWCFRVSDNPDVDENEPEILIDGMHHGREIMASEFPIMFAEYLASNYGVDPEITWLLDNRELYLIPIVNPDGVQYNELLDPNGGGMWRKNRRNNGDGTYGVDLNRNYPYQWGYDNIGSSPFTGDTTYRGPSAGSELETQMMMNFINSREIRTQDTVHCYGNMSLYPWGYIASPTPHDAIFAHMGAEMTKYNGYEAGYPADVLNYEVNGGSFDWIYGDGSHTEIFCFSNEIGSSSDGFWPAESRRGALFQENIWPHIYLMRVAGPFVTVHTPVVNAAAKAVEPGDDGLLSFTIENSSVVSSVTGLNLTLRTDDPWVQLLEAERSVGSLASLATSDLTADPIPFTVDAACPGGHQVKVTVTLHMADGDLEQAVSFVVGAPTYIFSDDFEGGTGNWTLTGTWGSTGSDYHSAGNSLTDSPSGSYVDESLTSATLNGVYAASKLSFWHRYDIESGYDYGRVQVSADGGAWTTLVSFDGDQNAWVQEVIDLEAYAGSDLQIRFLLDTDYSITYDGWYIDDVTLEGDPSASFAMVPPVAVSPVGGVATGVQPMLMVDNSANPGGGSVVYGFRVYGDALLTDLVASVDGVAEGAGQTSWEVPSLVDGTYWWRAWAGDGTDRTDLNQPESFDATGSSPVDLADGLGLRVLGNVTGTGSRLELSLPANAEVTLDIHDARGALVQRVHSGAMSSGVRVFDWDGRDRSGRNVASGVYFVRARIGVEQLSGRVVVVR